MVDFAGVKSITIPEGNVVKITSDDTVLWEKITSRLPSEYQEVEYIGMSGAQGIFYAEAFADVSEIIFTFSYSQFSSSYFTGTYFTNSPTHPLLTARLSGSGKQITCYSGQGEVGCVTPQISLDTVYTISLKADYPSLLQTMIFTQNDTVIRNSTSSIGARSNYDLYNFGVGCNGYLGVSNGNKGLFGNMYSFQHKSNGVVVRDFIPCYRKSDGVIGFYDAITKTFFDNDGTGNFTKGADV